MSVVICRDCGKSKSFSAIVSETGVCKDCDGKLSGERRTQARNAATFSTFKFGSDREREERIAHLAGIDR